MTDTPQLTSKKVVCFGGELFKTLHDLNHDGWRVSVITVKGACEYHLQCFLDWQENKPEQQELI